MVIMIMIIELQQAAAGLSTLRPSLYGAHAGATTRIVGVLANHLVQARKNCKFKLGELGTPTGPAFFESNSVAESIWKQLGLSENGGCPKMAILMKELVENHSSPSRFRAARSDKTLSGSPQFAQGPKRIGSTCTIRQISGRVLSSHVSILYHIVSIYI